MSEADCSALRAPPEWQRVAIASDIHLSPDEPETAALWSRALAACQADALILLGDYFDVWIGDDVLDEAITPQTPPAIAFWQGAAAELRAASARMPVYWISGNRDFLVGERFAQCTGVRRLCDPCTLTWGDRRWLLSHGDSWCTDDHDYMRFRSLVRSAAWQRNFLAQTLSQRLQTAREMRQASRSRQAEMTQWSDVHLAAVQADCARHGTASVIHGHTHRGTDTTVCDALEQHVTLDWCADSVPPRAQWMMLSAIGVERVDLDPQR